MFDSSQQGVRVVQNLLKQLITAAAQGQLASAMTQNASSLNNEIASEAREIFLRALQTQELVTAAAAASVAAAVYERLGNHTEQLRNLVDALQMDFMRASTVVEYKAVRHNAQVLAKQAAECGDSEFVFRARVMAAEAAHFAAEVDKDDVPWLILTLQDLLALCDQALLFRKSRFFIKFVDLLAGTVAIVMPRRFVPRDQPTIDGLLRALANKVNVVIPPDIEFPGNPQQTAKIAAVLTQFTDKYAA
jgi:hypothetical protein